MFRIGATQLALKRYFDAKSTLVLMEAPHPGHELTRRLDTMLQ